MLSLFTGAELRTMVCGSPDIKVSLLQSIATFRGGLSADSDLAKWLWETLEEFSQEERALFLRFVWGRTRLPATLADYRGRDFVIQVSVLQLVDNACLGEWCCATVHISSSASAFVHRCQHVCDIT